MIRPFFLRKDFFIEGDVMEKFRVKPIETERFLLRAVKIEDAKDMYEYCSDELTTKYVTFPTHDSVEVSKESIEMFFISRPEKGWPEAFAIVDKSNDKMIGTCDFWPLKDEGVYEMGYIINKEYWGQGVMTEVAKAVLDYAFANFDVEVMKLKHVVENQASGNIALKLGFTKLRVEPNGTSTSSGTHDAMCYELKREDYKNE